MKNLRTTSVSLAALSLSITTLASPVFGQERLGRQGVISFGQELVLDLDDGLQTRTDFGLNLSSATRTQTLNFNLGTQLVGEFRDNRENDLGFENYFGSLRYTRRGSNNDLTFATSYREVDLGIDSFEIDPGIIVIGEEEGSLTRSRIAGRVRTGLEGPFGLTLDASYRDVDFENTVDPDLSDEIVASLDALARFDLTRTLTLRARAGIAQREEEDVFQTETETTYVGLGIGGQTTGGLSFSADLIFDDTETTTLTPAATSTDDGVGFEIAAIQARRNGSIGVAFSSRIDETGRRTTAQVSRELTMSNGDLSLSLGVVDQEGVDGLEVIGGVSYSTATPQAEVTVSLDQATTTDDDDTVVVTNLALSYVRQIDTTSNWEARLGYVATDELLAGDNDNETRASVAYNRDLTSDWSMNTGFEYTFKDGGNDERELFFNIQRDITFGF